MKDVYGVVVGVEVLVEDVEKVVDVLEEDCKGEFFFDVGICWLVVMVEELWEE